MPTISIVTICYNNLQQLIETCASVDMQTVLPEEHIIVNGSTDDEIENWLNNQPSLPYRKIFHITNRGIAGNQSFGVEKSTADYINVMNASDSLASENVIEEVKIFLKNNNYPEWISGNFYLYRGSKWRVIGTPFDKTQLYKGIRGVCHQTWFVHKTVYEKVGKYNDYKIAMDYDMLCRIKNYSYKYFDFTIAKFDNTGLSSRNYTKSLLEMIKVYEANFGFSLKCRLWQIRQWFVNKILSIKIIGKIFYTIKEYFTRKR